MDHQECDYVPDREISDDGKSITLKQVFCGSYNAVELTQRIVDCTITYRNMSLVNFKCL